MAAFYGVCFKPTLEGHDLLYVVGDRPRKPIDALGGPSCDFYKAAFTASSHQRLFKSHSHSISKLVNSSGRKGARVKCSTGKAVTPSESLENAQDVSSVRIKDEVGPVIKFKMSDFSLCNHASIGLAGRGDEVIFEAIVRDSHSPLYNSRVVLRQLTSSQAQRRGRRALEVLKKLARRQLMYHSYAMQVHGYVSPSNGADHSSFTLVHGYHGSYSLQHWLRLSDWLPTLEATLALDEECARKVGEETIGGPAVSRKLRLIRMLMRDLLIGVNYLHSHGLAHTELRLENVHISPVDRHVKVGILGNAADLHVDSLNDNTLESNSDRKQLMIAFDMRCVGFMMAKMVLPELMDPSIFMKFKSFLTKGNDPSCLREFLLPILCKNSPSGNAGLQMLDRNWGAGWNLLSLMLATKPSERISCLDALRHPFLCGPKWRVDPSIDIIKWGLGSTAVRITEEYIYGRQQSIARKACLAGNKHPFKRNRLAYFIELMEMLNPYPKLKNWPEFLPGKWRLLYCTGKHIGLTLRQPSSRALIGNAYLTFTQTSDSNDVFTLVSDIDFTGMLSLQWPHDKTGVTGNLSINSELRLADGNRLYLSEETAKNHAIQQPNSQEHMARKASSRKWRLGGPIKDFPWSLPVAKLVTGEVEVTMSLDTLPENDSGIAGKILREVRMQVPPEMFDMSRLVCGTYIDSRLLILRGVSGSALLFTRSLTNC